jgi:hypothetical protein
MTETSPGRAAYEARLTAKSVVRLGTGLTPAWDTMNEGSRADWEAGAQAAIDVAQPADIRAERARAAQLTIDRDIARNDAGELRALLAEVLRAIDESCWEPRQMPWWRERAGIGEA